MAHPILIPGSEQGYDLHQSIHSLTAPRKLDHEQSVWTFSFYWASTLQTLHVSNITKTEPSAAIKTKILQSSRVKWNFCSRHFLFNRDTDLKQILSSEGANITIPRQRIRILCIIVRLNISTKSNTQASDEILSDKHIWHKQFLQFVLSILSRCPKNSQGSMANPKMILALFPMTTDLVFPSTYSDSPDNHLRFGIRIPPETFLKLSLSKEIWYGNNKPKMLTAYLWTQLAPHCRPKFVDRLAISHPLGSAVLQDVEHELTFEIQWMSKRDL